MLIKILYLNARPIINLEEQTITHWSGQIITYLDYL